VSARTGPPAKEAGRTPCKGRPATNDTGQYHHVRTDNDQSNAGTRRRGGSAAVSWWSVHEFVTPHLESVGVWPMGGTPEWVGLPDDHPAKLAALLDAAQHWALRAETGQQAQCQASQAISGAADWSAISREINARNDLYAQKPWLKRVSP
jgi:hypothetical protein